ncbi:MAG: phosphate starvation-inducible protein PhoH, partial [Propionibacteriaceae bacterium]|nr:phosphate starvation-inducible protein PhoH [Propionibacteriaceae bacterium]
MTIPTSIPMVNLLGPGDEFLRVLERELGADIHVRGNEVTLTGPPAAVAHGQSVLDELVAILRTGQGLTGADVERVVEMAAAAEVSAAAVLT